MKISRDLLMFFLYGKNEETSLIREPLPELEFLPSDVKVGFSMLPGAKYGIFARQHISRGLVVGPLNLPLGAGGEECSPITKQIHESWAWLKLIQPARHELEENARIEQLDNGGVYFRITQDIPAHAEILAWFSGEATGQPSVRSTSPPPSSGPLYSGSPVREDGQVCKLCGVTCRGYVELWAHMTTAHQLNTLPSSPPPAVTALPCPLPILPLSLPSIMKPYSPPRGPNSSVLVGTKVGSCTSPAIPRSTPITPPECRGDAERPYECGHCGKSFSLPSSLRRHIITHTGERPYKCGYCGRAFAGATTLNNHIRIHTGEKPHVCHDCGASFTQATQLNRHIRCCPGSKPPQTSEIFVK